MKSRLKKVKQELEGPEADAYGMYMQENKPKKVVDHTGKLPREIDLVSNRMKMKQLRDAIKLVTDKLIDSKPVVPWKYTGKKDTVEMAFNVNHVPGFVKKKEKVDSDEESLDSEEERKKNKNKTKLYDKDFSEVRKFPWKFKYDEKELDDDEEDDFDDGYSAPRKKRNKKKSERSEVTPDYSIGGSGMDFGF